MALKPCRECKKEVSTEAKTCPHCGVSEPTKAPASAKDTLIGLVVVVVAIVAAVRMCGDSDAEKKAAEEKRAAEAAACRKDLQCYGDHGTVAAGILCREHVERLAKNSMRWRDGTLEPKFSRFRWKDASTGAITFLGDKAEFMNGFGAYVNMIYECDLDGEQKHVLDVRARQGRL